MSKTSLALTSLVAAVPAAFLAYLMVMTFLSRAEHMTGMMQVLAGMTLLVSAVMMAMPAGILIFGPKAGKAKKKDEEAEELLADEDEEAIGVESAAELDADEMDETVAYESDELEADVDEFEAEEGVFESDEADFETDAFEAEVQAAGEDDFFDDLELDDEET